LDRVVVLKPNKVPVDEGYDRRPVGASDPSGAAACRASWCRFRSWRSPVATRRIAVAPKRTAERSGSSRSSGHGVLPWPSPNGMASHRVPNGRASARPLTASERCRGRPPGVRSAGREASARPAQQPGTVRCLPAM